MAKIGSNETFTESLDNTLIQLVLYLGCAVFPKNQKRHNLRANVVLKWQPIKVGSAKNLLILHYKEYRFFTLLNFTSCHIHYPSLFSQKRVTYLFGKPKAELFEIKKNLACLHFCSTFQYIASFIVVYLLEVCNDTGMFVTLDTFFLLLFSVVWDKIRLKYVTFK